MLLLLDLLGFSDYPSSSPSSWRSISDEEIAYGTPWWWIYAGISAALVLFAGIMSGLTLGLMSLGLMDLEVLQQSGTEEEKKQAATILPVVKEQHQLLVTLLLCNAAAMEALPIFLDTMFNEVVAVILSVTFVLAFGEVIPQALCSRHGLAIGANFVWLVKILMVLCFPISYPVGKVLDYLLGHSESALFRRAQLKALVSIHGKEAGRGGDLTHDETTIIQGALDMTEKTALDSMTPIESTFSLDIQSKLDWETLEKILARGHSRVPVYDGNPRNIIGLLLVKSLVTVRAEDETPLSAVSIRRMPRVGSDMPLYDILNEFQKGGSHMAAVIKSKQQRKDVRLHHQEITMDGSDECNCESGDKDLEKGIQIGAADNDENQPEHSSQNGEENGKKEQSHIHSDDPLGGSAGQVDDVEEGEVIGIITLEDVMEELLQEEILDETDEFIDVHRRVRVAAVAAAQVNRAGSLVRRVGSFSHPQLGLSKQGQHAVNKVREVQEWRQKSLAAIDNDITTPLLGVDRT
ncbi:unnamed protein product [Sphagnum jensenii]|uniref:CNNM transmembrane domain-containing protein n=1 Tax=Sphagnum jensenii TaxID=128206 RepID=A0ABP1AT83_9BRYO